MIEYPLVGADYANSKDDWYQTILVGWKFVLQDEPWLVP